MHSFELHIPTQIYYGKEKATVFFEQLSSHGKKAFIVIGGGSVKKAGYLNDVQTQLKINSIESVLFEGIEANPRSQTINKAAKEGKQAGIDFVLALGGGSVMDASKAIAGLIHDDADDIWPYTVGGKKYREMKGALPVAAIPTTAATASEVTAYAVISNPEVKGKSSLGYPFLKPVAAWLNPAFHTSIPAITTRDGAADILSHVFENYLLGGDESALADRYSEGIMLTVMKTLPEIETEPTNEHLRGQMMWASTLALNGMQQAGRKVSPFTLHNLEHSLSGQNPELSHGRGLATLYPAYFRWLWENDRVKDRLAQLGERLFNVSETDISKAAMEFIDRFEEWLQENTLYQRLSDVGISKEVYGDVADYAIETYGGGTGQLTAAGPLTREYILEIFEKTEEQRGQPAGEMFTG
ncbi:MAG: iron-containing alcohol dehydrogenase [Balneolaceae bacterium]